MFNIEEAKVLVSFKKDSKKSFYNPVIGKINNRCCYAYIETNQESEKLILSYLDGESLEIHVAKYISSPVIREGGILCSVYENAFVWRVVWIKINNVGVIEKSYIDNNEGKRDFIALDSTSKYAVYEKRIGIKTKICITEYKDCKWQEEKEITDGTFNCYDPQVAKQGDEIYVIFTGFLDGNYHIFIMVLNNDLSLKQPAKRISDQKGICAWPSIYPRKKGGVLICFSSFSRDIEYETSYLQHDKYAARRRLFTNFAEVYAGVFLKGKLYMNVEENKTIGYIEPLKVNNATTSKYPRIFEIDNEIYILLRNYPSDKKMFSVPSVSITTLTDDGWTEPEVLIENGLHEEPISYILGKEYIEIVSGVDLRKKGANVNAECFDDKNSIEIRYYQITFDRIKTTKVGLYEHVVSIAGMPSIEENEYSIIKRDKYKLIWGQTHSHTNFSICQRMNDQNSDMNFRFFQDVQKSLFGATTDHGYNMWEIEKHLVHKKADYYYFPGSFIAIPAYEWTGSSKVTIEWGGPFGHVNPLYLEEEGEMEIFVAVDKKGRGSTLNKLWKQYKDKKIITIPHHTADKGHYYNWDNYDSNFVPIVEIFQDCRGEHEQRGALGSTSYWKTDNKNAWVIDALNRKYKLGFIGGGDHSGSARGGALVTEITREALYDAFVNRRCYASSGAGADICFAGNGLAVGSVIEDEICNFIFEINTNDDISIVELVKNGETIKDFRNLGRYFKYEFETNKASEFAFYYFRIGTKNGEVFWTSPIWH